jgi:hypothetical protein
MNNEVETEINILICGYEIVKLDESFVEFRTTTATTKVITTNTVILLWSKTIL